MNKEAPYWMTLAHDLTPFSFSNREGWKNEEKMNLIIHFFHENKISIEAFFNLSNDNWKNDYQLTDKQILDLTQAKEKVASNAFLAETLYNSGIEIVPIISPDYSKTLKEILKKSAPIVLYIKGNKQIMQEKSIAIVGSREASDVALQFTDSIAKLASKEYKVVVSGFAKGVDKQALDSAIAYKGQSIIVLPQGIMTFESGFKTYYKQIMDGDVLVLSTFPPKAGWSKDLAMARNPIIYGLAKEIFVAESKPSKNRQGKETKGGTYAGVIDGLKKGRIIYVRKPDVSEKNDNNFLIQSGAVAVDSNGDKAIKEYEYNEMQYSMVSEPQVEYNSFPNRIKQILSHGHLTIKDIHKRLHFEKSDIVLKKELEKLDFIEIKKEKNKTFYLLKGKNHPTLFEL